MRKVTFAPVLTIVTIVLNIPDVAVLRAWLFVRAERPAESRWPLETTATQDEWNRWQRRSIHGDDAAIV